MQARQKQSVHNYGDSKISGYQGLGGRDSGIGRAQSIFKAVKLFCKIQ